MLLPLAAQPVFDLRTGGQEAAFQFEEGPGEGGGEVRNHELYLNRGLLLWLQILHRSAGKDSQPVIGLGQALQTGGDIGEIAFLLGDFVEIGLGFIAGMADQIAQIAGLHLGQAERGERRGPVARCFRARPSGLGDG